VTSKYELETIPVWAAVEQGAECPICHLKAQSESRNVEFFLGSSIMAPEMRVQVNERGFCTRHFHMLLGGTGRLGLSLALSTHIEDLMRRVARTGGRTTSGRRAAAATMELASMLESQACDCLMCDRIRNNVSNYVYTLTRLFASDEGFRDLFVRSHGLCLIHLAAALRMGAEILSANELRSWNRSLLEITERDVTSLREELEAFSWQFDATSDRKTPDSAQDSVPRSVRKLAGSK